MKVIVVGCTHAGTFSILNIKELYPDVEVNVYERNNNISYLSCGIALDVGNIIDKPEGLFYSSPKVLRDLGVNTFMNHNVIDIDVDNKTIKVVDMATNEEKIDSYDKLVLTLGSWPIEPNIKGSHLDNILLCKNYDHAQNIIKTSKDAKNIIVIGAGYIGVELAESFERIGKNVTIIDAEDHIMNKYLDPEFSTVCEEEFRNKGINIATNEIVESFEGTDGKVSKVITNNGSYDADLVIMSVGFRPNTKLLEGKVEMLDNGAIVIDEYMHTSQKDIFAAGDCCVVKFNPANDYRYIPLATNAIRMGILVANNLVTPKLKYLGTQATSGIKIYDYCIASTGLSEITAKNTTNKEVDTVIIEDNYRPEFMPSFEAVKLKIVYDKNTHEVLGGQIMSKYDMTQMMNTLSVVIQNKMTIEELAMVDFFFMPHFNKPWSLLNSAALEAIKKI